jgi:NodT family efflux transporter outer membrane factor (OMF) lipoprotein
MYIPPRLACKALVTSFGARLLSDGFLLLLSASPLHSTASRLALIAALLSPVLLAACEVGPDFKRPDAPATSQFEETPLPDSTSSADNPTGSPQQFQPGADIVAEWWTLYHSEPLNRLIKEALRANPDLQSAEATLREAQENTAAAEGYLFPTVTGDFNTVRQKTSGAAYGGTFPGSVYTVHTAQVSVSYGLDVFGGTRRAIEQVEAQEEYSRFQLEAAYVTLTTNLVNAAVNEASLRGQIKATQQIIAAEEKQLKVAEAQFQYGAASKAVVLLQQATLEQTRATLPALEKRLGQNRHLLSVLTGHLPSDPLPANFTLDTLALPTTLPVSLPSNLVEQRPDIRAAEANLHYASAGIGVAIANRLPQVSLSADLGDAATNLGKLFTPGTGIWSMGLGLSQTLFDAGTLAHKQGAAEAAFDASAAQYRSTVLSAFQDVADTLRALRSDADALNAQTVAERAAAGSLKLSQEQYKDGSITYVVLLNAEQTEQQAVINLVQAEAQRYADTAALFQALGGGWWNRKPDIDAYVNAPANPPGDPASEDAVTSGGYQPANSNINTTAPASETGVTHD